MNSKVIYIFQGPVLFPKFIQQSQTLVYKLASRLYIPIISGVISKVSILSTILIGLSGTNSTNIHLVVTVS